MPYLEQLVNNINEQIKSSLKFISEGQIATYGISEAIVEPIDEKSYKSYPAIINEDGDATMIEINDVYGIIIYHKLDSITNALALTKNQWGNEHYLSESANMTMIVIAFRDQVKRTASFLEAVIKDKLEETMAVETQKSTLRPGASNFDKLSILTREYLNSAPELNFPQLIIFELKYVIASIYKKGCLDNCLQC